MRIDPAAPAPSPSQTAKATPDTNPPGEHFSAFLARQAGLAPVPTATPAAPVTATIASAIPTAAPPRDREAHRHARALLVALRALQAAMLAGGTGTARAALEDLAHADVKADDPTLADTLRQIALRAAIELARTA